MSTTRKMRTNEECVAHAFHRKSLRRSFALVLGVGLSASLMESKSSAQYLSGDLPASPWANRGENIQGRRTDDTSRPASARLRQPTSTQSDGSIDLRSTDVRSEATRPAPVILMGPMTPNVRPQPQSLNLDRSQDSSRNSRTPINSANQATSNYPNQTTALPSQALTQKKPIDAQSDWHRLQAGGLVLEAEDARFFESPMQDINERTAATAPSANRRIGAGLPDREDATNSIKLPSQMASAKSSAERDEPVASNLPGPIIEKEISEPDLNRPTLSLAAPSKPNIASTVSRNESVLQLEAPTKVSVPAPSTKETLVASNVNPFPVVLAPAPLVESNSGSPVNSPVANSMAANSMPTSSVPANSTPAVDEYQMKKFALAQRVSHELLSNMPTISARAPEALESLPGWQSVERELKQRLERCDTLLKRGVVLSAREEASQGLLRLYRTMDLHRGSLYSEPAFEKALVAFREEQDFQKNIRSSQGISVQAVVDTHATEALKNRPLESTSPEMAAMHYRWYARYQLLTASDGHPWAADLLYAYGKTLEKEAELNPARSITLRSQAVVCYQAATQNRSESKAMLQNQLGPTRSFTWDRNG